MDELDIARWYVHLAETSNKAFMPLFFDEHRFLVLKGGGGSGKSVFAARKLIERAFAEPGHRFLVCRKVAKTLRESCWRNILDQLSKYYPGRYSPNKSDLTITCDNGSTFLFAGLDDVEKLKSIVDVTGEWIEEASELLEGDLNQLNIRLRGETREYKQIILTFNPISITHWLKLRFFDRQDPNARVHESTYRDNRFLPEEDRKVLLRGLLSGPVGHDRTDCVRRRGRDQKVIGQRAAGRRGHDGLHGHRAGLGGDPV